MGQTLTNGVYLPDEGERNCYTGLAANWRALDAHLGEANIHVTYADKEAWNNHVADTVKHVTAADKEAWNGHVADTTIHVTSVDKQAWNGHVADSVKHVTAEDKAKWDAVTSKADDSDVVHKSGNETVGGIKTFSSQIAITAHPSIRMYLTDDDWGVLPQTTKQSEIRFTDKNSVLVSYFAFQHRTDSNEPFRTCWRQQKMDGTSGYNSINFNNLGDFYPENTNAISLGRVRNRWKDVNTYLVNGINPGALSLPADRGSRVDIAAYFTNTGNGDENTYTAPANGYIFLDVTSINKIILFSQTASQQMNYAQTLYGGLDGRIYSFFPVRKNDLFKSRWYTGSAANVTNAFFIPCQGNV